MSGESKTQRGADFAGVTGGDVDVFDQKQSDDQLIEWLQDRIRLPNYKPSMWKPEHDLVARDFLSRSSITKLVVYLDKDLDLCMHTLNVPSVNNSSVKRLQYFIKCPGVEVITRDNAATALHWGMLSGGPMDSLLRLMTNVYLPTFLNNDSWPESVRKEFSKQTHKFMASLTETANQIQGQTILYLPEENLDDLEAAVNDKDLLQRLESTLIHWTRQIKEVVSNQETSHNVDNATPLDEISFWRSRAEDLSGIQEQLARPGVHRIVKLLEQSGSEAETDLESFRKLHGMILSGSMEARNNLVFLSTLRGPCEKLQQAELSDIPALLPRILSIIRMIWSCSEYYGVPERLTSLLRKLSSQIIVQCRAKIDLREIFMGDVIHAMQQLDLSAECRNAWRAAFYRMVDLVSRDRHTPNWDFDPDKCGIFAQIDAFVQRCSNLREVCQGQMQFARKTAGGRKLPLPCFGGTKGEEVEKNLLEIEQVFEKHIELLQSLDYDILNVKATSWHVDYNFFKAGLHDLDVMMANVVKTAWESVSTVKDSVEVLESFASLAVRQKLLQVIKRRTVELWMKLEGDVRSVKQLFDKRNKDPPLPPGWPRYAGSALWARSLSARLAVQFATLENATALPEVRESALARERYNEEVTRLSKFIRRCWEDWKSLFNTSDSEQLDARLERPLIVRSNDGSTAPRKKHHESKKAPAQSSNDGEEVDEKQAAQAVTSSMKNVTIISKSESGHLESNFDKHLLRMFTEVRYWRKFGNQFTIPYGAQQLYAKQDELRTLRDSVLLVVRDYNTILEALDKPGERELFAEHLRQVNETVTPGLENLVWSERHVKDWFIKMCREKCRDVMAVVKHYKVNDLRLKTVCKEIGRCLLIDIEKGVVYDDVIFSQRQRRHQERMRNHLTMLHEQMLETMRDTHLLFAEHPSHVQRQWVQYVENIDAEVEQALRSAAKKSLQLMSKAVNGAEGADDKKELDIPALFKVDLVLDTDDNEVQLQPSTDDLAKMIRDVSKECLRVLKVVPRLHSVLKSAQAPSAGGVSFQTGDGVEKTAPTLVGSSGSEEKGTGTGGEDETDKRAAAPAPSSFYKVIVKANTQVQLMASIMQGSYRVEEEIGRILVIYDGYQHIWTTDKNNTISRADAVKKALPSFELDIQKYKDYQTDIQTIDTMHTVSWLRVDGSRLREALIKHCRDWQLSYTTYLHSKAKDELKSVFDLYANNIRQLKRVPKNINELADADKFIKEMKKRSPEFAARIQPLEDTYKCLHKYATSINDEETDMFESLQVEKKKFERLLVDTETSLSVLHEDMKRELEDNMISFNHLVLDLRTEFKERGPFSVSTDEHGGSMMVSSATVSGSLPEPKLDKAFKLIQDFRSRLKDSRQKLLGMKQGMELFDIEMPQYKEMDDTEVELGLLEKVWVLIRDWLARWEGWKREKFSSLSVKSLDGQAKEFQKRLNAMTPSVKQWKVWKYLFFSIQKFRLAMPLITNLRSPAMRPRHWKQLQQEINQEFDPTADDFTLEKVYALKLHNYAQAVAQLIKRAERQSKIESTLEEIEKRWQDEPLDLVPYKGGKYVRLRSVEQINELLEQHGVTLTNMKGSPYYLTFAKPINQWERIITEVNDTLEGLTQVQRSWMYLESIFMESPNIRKQRPSEFQQFDRVNTDFRGIMARLFDQQRALALLGDRLLDRLNGLQLSLDKVKYSLDQWLETKRQLFPRFYFLSNDDLLEILGQARDPVSVNKHVRKCFTGIQRLDLEEKDAQSFDVVGMVSPAGERVPLSYSVPVEGEVETWLRDVETTMVDTLQRLLVSAVSSVPKSLKKKASLEQWIKGTKGQLLIASAQVEFTRRVSHALADKSRKPLRKLRRVWGDYLKTLASYVKTPDMKAEERTKITALITIEVHAKAVLDDLRSVSKHRTVTPNSFEWTSQLRFYFQPKQGAHGTMVIKQTNTSFDFGYEYQPCSRLVITPLTDRCYMTLTTALHLCRGGSPQGPAGTGKTETVKDLGKNMGKMTVVFNCSPKMMVASLAKDFSGLAQTGAWGCFDEFNRIKIEVLSVVAIQVRLILESIQAGLNQFELDGTTMELDRTCGIFVTMNPGYAGRTELPDNLKSLFRPVSMVRPDTQRIAEVMLQAEGFKSSAGLAQNIVTVFDLMQRQLSLQPHYAYGLRAVKSVLSRAGVLKRSGRDSDLPPEMLILRAISDMNSSKLVPEDRFLFQRLLSDTFPNMELNEVENPQLREEVLHQIEATGLQKEDYTVDKAMQVFENQGIRHGNMLVGGPLSGKTVAWKTLRAALGAMAEKQPKQYRPVDVHCLNPKAVSTDELFGCYDPHTKEWKDGIFSMILRQCCNSSPERTKWILLDGLVDTLWIESMNSLLDDNKLLTLVNGDRISLPDHVSILFEVEHLVVASPATVSRCGMIYCDSESLGWRPLVNCWLQKKLDNAWLDRLDQAELEEKDAGNSEEAAEAKTVGSSSTQSHSESKSGDGGEDDFEDEQAGNDHRVKVRLTKEAITVLGKLFDKYVAKMLQWKDLQGDVDMVTVTDSAAVASLLRLFDAVATVDNGVDPADEAHYLRLVEMQFLFCCIWSIGGALKLDARVKFDAFVRDLEAQFPPLQTCFEYFVDPHKKDWVLWETQVNTSWRRPPVPFHQILVPTVDTVRYDFLLRALINARHHTLVVGHTGTGKTSIIQHLLRSLNEKQTLCLNCNFSAATTAHSTQALIESRLEKRQRMHYGPVGARNQMIVFIDDLNMPKKEIYGAQPAIELLRQWMDFGFWYDTHTLQRKIIDDMQLVGAMGPAGGARSVIDNRFRARFNAFHFTMPEDPQILRIFRTLIVDHLSEFDEIIKPLGPVLARASVDLYHQVTRNFRPVPSCPHYLFNLRDISKVTFGVLRSRTKYFDTPESVVRLWLHECLRVFGDRLRSQPDRDRFLSLLDVKLQTLFDSSWSRLFTDKNYPTPLFVDFMHSETNSLQISTSDEKDEDANPYQEVLPARRRALRDYLNQQLEFGVEMRTPGLDADLVLFDDAIEHVCRIYRIITQPRGSACLVGVGGSGRQSLTRLASVLAKQNLFQITVTKSYNLSSFREDLVKLYVMCGLRNEKTVFLFSDTQVVDERLVEDINSILNNGEIVDLFPPDELGHVLERMRAHPGCRNLSQDALYQRFIHNVRENLHVVFCVSPVGSSFRNRCRMFPAIVNNMNIDWFSHWPSSALNQVAVKYLAKREFGDTRVRQSLAEVFSTIHTSVQEAAENMGIVLRRHNYVTHAKFLDSVRSFLSLVRRKQGQIESHRAKLENGINILLISTEQVERLSILLKQKKQRVSDKENELNKLRSDMVEQSQHVANQRQEVSKSTEQISKQSEELAHTQMLARLDLEKVEPQMRAAEAAVKKISKKAVSEVKSYASPPKIVGKVMAAVMTVLGYKEPTWAMAKAALSNPNFLKVLMDFKAEEMSDGVLKRVQRYTKQKDFNADSIAHHSTAAGYLCEWVCAIDQFGKVYRDMLPRRRKLEQAQANLNRKEAELKISQDRLNALTAELEGLQNHIGVMEGDKKRLQNDMEELNARLARAQELVSGLAGKKVIWESMIKELSVDLSHVTGDAILATALISYAGPFPGQYREELLTKHWIPAVRIGHISHSANFDFCGFMVERTAAMDWNLQGLPTDSFSVENGVLVTQSERWPLMIDPQSQANLWMKTMVGPSLVVLDPQTKDYVIKVETAVSSGHTVLIQGVGEQLDPSLNPILSATTVGGDIPSSVMIGERELSYHPRFRLYLTTKATNPHYTPEIFMRCNIINFAVVEQGLQDQLLGIVFTMEQPQLEQSKVELVRGVTAGKKKLVELNDTILSLLKSAGENILDNKELINTLNTSKTMEEKISQEVEQHQETERSIDLHREAYRGCAERAAMCFFVLMDMSQVDPMYEFSLAAYVSLFKSSVIYSKEEKKFSIQGSGMTRRAQSPEVRVKMISDTHTEAVYRYTCRALFEKHKLLFAFKLCIEKLKSEGRIDQQEFDFFLRGGNVLDSSLRPPNPCPWLPDQLWDNITELDKLPSFKTLAHSFDQYNEEWYAWYHSKDNTPEKHPPPGEWQNKRDDFQQMLVLRCLRPDRIVFAAKDFIQLHLGSKFIESPSFDMLDIYKASSNVTPVVFVLSPGVDPFQNLQTLASQLGQRLEMRALGQGQSQAAERLFRDGAREGFWVYLANCHLSLSWLSQLSKMVESLMTSQTKPHQDFRLFLSSDPHPDFPISLLQNSVKMTTEPPRGLRANMLRLYGNMDPGRMERGKRSAPYKKLLFSLSFFHAVVVERRKFGSLGWNVTYAFNDSDFEVCENILALYIDQYEQIPWAAVKYLIAEAFYGGRVTDRMDRNLLKVYVDQYFCADTLEVKDYHLSSLEGVYVVPPEMKHAGYVKYIKELPSADNDLPEAFGQHPNADIASQVEQSKTLVATLLELQPRLVPQGEKSREEVVLSLIQMLRQQDYFPTELDERKINAKFANDRTPLTIVLLQEVGRINIVIRAVHRTLKDLERGLRGEVVISPELEVTFDSLYTQRTPKQWHAVYPSVKALVPWMRELGDRVAQLQKWVRATPKVFWLGGFTFPVGFLTALKQLTVGRMTNTSISQLGWEFVVMAHDENSLNPPREGGGAYVKGLLLENARWSKEQGLVDPVPMCLFDEMPIILFKPVVRPNKHAKGAFHCPMYMYPVRTGPRERPSFLLEVELKSNRASEFWVKRGVALLLNWTE